ncbi:hypothetical protein N7462_003241 [Penicillium macrosclerotiorum]|uniref:uncharacterized protein n=1 Tax=Penicillium macrosclerotiorum TaxID=303699 RepID=UPI0025481602|nr:uncharacterized protein N7462_003241 [Penicillium macrosclerotiorum]KAJ5688849.1 hypothetical protein N7462_003241 [Penicillium macrosclerotiorum]
MSSRFPPSSGFNSRDRSPQRFGDRRPPAGARGPDDSPSFGREPPRGPRALVDSPGRGAPFGGRGRGGYGRGDGRGDFRDRDRDIRDIRDPRDRDFRDSRDNRDLRDGPPFRRDMDRDWNRRDRDFDPRESSRIGGFGRGRSRSPTRDFRDLRDPPGRDFDMVRMRRNSRDSILSASSGGPDGPPSSGGHPRGGGSMRGRGRGDWEGGRGRGRPPYLDDREPFRRRSRSRDAWRDRGRDRLLDRDRDRDPDRDRLADRDRLPDRDRILDRDRDRDSVRDRERDRDMDRRDRFDRREDWDSRRPDRDDRDRPLESWKRERPPSRAENRGAPGSTTAPAPHVASSSTVPSLPERVPDQPPVDLNRKASVVSGPSMTDSRRDSDRPEPVSLRAEAPKDLGPTDHQSPPSAPQVPAFGSVAAPILAVPTAKGSHEERTPNDPSTQTDKDRNERPRRPSVQPPAGPKAERGQSLQPTDSRGHASDASQPPEEPAPTARPSVHLSDRSAPTAPAAMTKQDSVSGVADAPISAKPTSVTTSPTFARLPPPAPRALSRDPSISPRMQSSTIPTGPRAYQQRLSSSPRGVANKGIRPWSRSSFGRAPSISSVPPKREPDDLADNLPSNDRPPHDVQPGSPTLPDELESTDNVSAENIKAISPSTATSMKLAIRSSPPPVPSVEAEHEAGPEESKTQKTDNDTSAPIPDFTGSSDEEDEENVVFNQEYLEERKRIFEKDMQALRSEMPPSPLEDPNIVSLLLRIQMLGKIAHEDEVAEQESIPFPSVEEADASPPTNNERTVSFAPTVLDRKSEPIPLTVVPPIVPRDDITVDGLPFLQSGPPTPISDMEVCHENDSIQKRRKDVFRDELSRRQKEVSRKNAALKEEYMSYYKPWRLAVWELDRSKEKKPMTPGPASPPAPPPPATPASIPEGREGRRYKGNSELDFLNALKASEISAQEELERRRTKMATARPDLAREAIIPDMLELREEKAHIYKDVNNTIDPSQAMEVFGFLPPPNDFTKEEHVIFTDAFMAHPKKWGKIAEALPGRDFQQCIIHYYLTKEEIKYKAKLNKRWSRRGRGKPRSTRPKSNALIADLGVVKPDFDGEEEPPAVTDTGRPRRAAAPTFGGESNEAEGAAAGRRGQTAKDGEPTDKAPARRGGRTAGPRAQRRAKPAAQQDPKVQAPPPPPINPPLAALPPNMDIGVDGLVEAGLLPQEREIVVEKEVQPAPPIPRPRAGRGGRAKEGMYVFESTEAEPAIALKQSETGYGSLQPTSYWSVPEQRDFPRLLAHFGRDFEGISNFMKTKTTVMVKNYYQRRLDSGHKDFEEIVLIAEDKKSRGEPTGALPVPSVAPKRRYEATPSAIVPRPLAPHGEMISDGDEGRYSAKGKALAMSPQPVPLQGRPLSENERASNRYPPLAQASTAASVPPVAAPLGDEASRAMRGQPGRISGPRLGYFTDERRDSLVLTHSGARVQEMQMPSRHSGAAGMPPDLARMDPLSAQPYMAGQPPPPNLPPSHSRHPSLTQAPGSPTQLSRPELEVSSVHRDPFAQRQYYPLSSQPAGMSQSPRPVLSPVKDVPRPSATPAPESRHVPAKRSNIMSILNDEPEEPQPRKRFASEAPLGSSSSSAASRSVYQPGGPTRPEDSLISGATPKPSSYGQPGSYQAPARGYADYGAYGPPPSGSGPSANNDWMARFDPRAQQAGPPAPSQPQPPQNARTALSAQGSYSHYVPAPPQPAGALNGLPVPSPAPTPPPAASQRPAYPNVFSQAAPTQQAAATSSRDMPSQPPVYRPVSPPPRVGSTAYASRQEQPAPAQSSTNIFGIPPRQPGTQSSYSPATPSTPSSAQPHSQSYQQHVQTLVNGAHQSHRSTPVNLAGGPQYGHSTPPPQAQASRSMPSLAPMGRSYTPPSALHPGAMGYAPPPPSAGAMPPLHQRPTGPGALGEPSSTPTHHRVYSQGSAQGGLPGPLHPPQPR